MPLRVNCIVRCALSYPGTMLDLYMCDLGGSSMSSFTLGEKSELLVVNLDRDIPDGVRTYLHLGLRSISYRSGCGLHLTH